ncbi:MAG: glycoside hydrolase family 25 protein [Eggerthellaceae bacterium]|nr:glycoside hydrolase family 25 protein [Eggerthellaceae bacterium]
MKIAIVVVAILLLDTLISAVSSCSKKDKPQTDAPETTYSTQYNWDNLSTEGGSYTFVVDGKTVSRLGIDVSESQGTIDWDAVAADGIDYAIVRVGYRGTTEGDVFTDTYFDTNIDGAIDAGLDVGVYFYSQAVNEDEAREEAERCIYEINKRNLQYPVFFDYEKTADQSGRADKISSIQATANARAFCEAIEAEGYKAAIYGNQNDLNNYFLMPLHKYPVWYAEYNSLPTSNHEFTMWQYTNKGTVKGISTDVDLNIDLSKVPADTSSEEEQSS